VKWNALAARQVWLDEGTGSIWSWGWGVFGPTSVDPDKPAAACVYLWTRDPSMCDGPGMAGPAFNTSLTEGQIVLPTGAQCTLAGGAVTAAAVQDLARLTRSPQTALTALFARAALRLRVSVPQSDVLAVESDVIDRVFRGSRRLYLRGLARSGATLAVARGVIADELRRRQIAALPDAERSSATTQVWSADVEAAAADTATCLRDELPGTGDFPASNAREIGVVPLPALLPYLFADRQAAAVPVGLVATPGPGSITLDWTDAPEADLVGYHVYRAVAPGGPYVRVTTRYLTRSTLVDAPPPGLPAYYVVKALDSSRNLSGPSVEVTATPA
jgi:hypothetical protein